MRKSGHIARNCVDSKYRPQEGQERTVNAVVEEEEYEELEASIAEITKNSR
jgi:deoxyhypusine synthase